MAAYKKNATFEHTASVNDELFQILTRSVDSTMQLQRTALHYFSSETQLYRPFPSGRIFTKAAFARAFIYTNSWMNNAPLIAQQNAHRLNSFSVTFPGFPLSVYFSFSRASTNTLRLSY